MREIESGKFVPGHSGNPSGRPKMDKTIRDLAKSYTEAALQTLIEIAKNPEASEVARIQAAVALLDRGWGKPVQYSENETVLTAAIQNQPRVREIDLEERIKLIQGYQLENALK